MVGMRHLKNIVSDLANRGVDYKCWTIQSLDSDSTLVWRTSELNPGISARVHFSADVSSKKILSDLAVRWKWGGYNNNSTAGMESPGVASISLLLQRSSDEELQRNEDIYVDLTLTCLLGI